MHHNTGHDLNSIVNGSPTQWCRFLGQELRETLQTVRGKPRRDSNKLEGNVLFEPAAPMFYLLIFGNVSLKTVVLLIGEISHPLESVLLLIGKFSLPLETVLLSLGELSLPLETVLLFIGEFSLPLETVLLLITVPEG